MTQIEQRDDAIAHKGLAPEDCTDDTMATRRWSDDEIAHHIHSYDILTHNRPMDDLVHDEGIVLFSRSFNTNNGMVITLKTSCSPVKLPLYLFWSITVFYC